MAAAPVVVLAAHPVGDRERARVDRHDLFHRDDAAALEPALVMAGPLPAVARAIPAVARAHPGPALLTNDASFLFVSSASCVVPDDAPRARSRFTITRSLPISVNNITFTSNDRIVD